MKKFLCLLAALMLLPAALAQSDAPTVYVSVTDDTGALVLACAPVALADCDGDGSLTLCDALIAAHAAHHPQGAEAFAVEATAYGLSMLRLWGIENGGSYGYCLNDASAMSLADPIADGDHVKAYCFTDLAAWSDTYSFFGAPFATVTAGEALPLTLFAAGYDAAWNPVTLPVEGAVITVDGAASGAITDAAGEALVPFSAPGVYIISATCPAMTLVAPVCIVTVVAP